MKMMRNKCFSLTTTFFRMVSVVLCLQALAVLSQQKGFAISFSPAPKEGSYTDDALKKATPSDEMKKLRLQLSKIKDAVPGKSKPKVSEAIVRRKLQLLAGNNVDCKYFEMENETHENEKEMEWKKKMNELVI